MTGGGVHIVDPEDRPDLSKRTYHELSGYAGPAYGRRARLDPATCPVAGVPAIHPERGAGTFVYQTKWSLNTPEIFGHALPPSETRRRFPAPPPGVKPPPVPAPRGEGIPVGPDRPSYTSVTKADFSPSRLTHAAPYHRVNKLEFEESVRYRNQVSSMGTTKDVVGGPHSSQVHQRHSHGFESTTKLAHGYKEGVRNVAERNAYRAGKVRTTAPRLYNIITGAEPLANMVSERWNPERDYRRQGPVRPDELGDRFNQHNASMRQHEAKPPPGTSLAQAYLQG